MSFKIGVSSVHRQSNQQWIGVSGVWRPVLGMWVGVSGAWRRYHSLGAVGTVTTGGMYNNSHTGFINYVGFAGGTGAVGSISGSMFPDGVHQVVELINRSGGNGAHLGIGGFTSSPGSSWLDQIVCNGVTLLGSAASFTYSLGTAHWSWSGSTFGMVGGGSSYPFIVVPTP